MGTSRFVFVHVCSFFLSKCWWYQHFDKQTWINMDKKVDFLIVHFVPILVQESRVVSLL